MHNTGCTVAFVIRLMCSRIYEGKGKRDFASHRNEAGSMKQGVLILDDQRAPLNLIDKRTSTETIDVPVIQNDPDDSFEHCLAANSRGNNLADSTASLLLLLPIPLKASLRWQDLRQATITFDLLHVIVTTLDKRIFHPTLALHPPHRPFRSSPTRRLLQLQHNHLAPKPRLQSSRRQWRDRKCPRQYSRLPFHSH